MIPLQLRSIGKKIHQLFDRFVKPGLEVDPRSLRTVGPVALEQFPEHHYLLDLLTKRNVIPLLQLRLPIQQIKAEQFIIEDDVLKMYGESLSHGHKFHTQERLNLKAGRNKKETCNRSPV
jgi:hypothetical protein